MSGYKGIGYLRNKLASKQNRIETRYNYYEMKNAVKDFGMTTPSNLRWIKAVLGWSAKSVDSIADRLLFREFQNDNFDMNGIFQLNNPDTLFDSAILSALITSCSFIYIAPDEDNYPRLQVLDGRNATGIMDPITGLLKEGYAVIERDDNGSPIVEAYFTVGETRYIRKGESTDELFSYNVNHPLLVPVVYRPDAKRDFGHSRISRACMSIQQEALRTLKRSEISAEFYSYPQKYILGMSPDAEMADKWKATISTML